MGLPAEPATDEAGTPDQMNPCCHFLSEFRMTCPWKELSAHMLPFLLKKDRVERREREKAGRL